MGFIKGNEIDRHHAARFAFLLSALPWALKHSDIPALLPILPLPTVHSEGVLRGRRIAFC